MTPQQPIIQSFVSVNGSGKVYLAVQDTGPTQLTSAQPYNHFGDSGQNFNYEVWVGQMNFTSPPPAPPVLVNLPPNGQVTTLPLHYVATATSPTCAKGVASVGVYTAPGKLQTYQNGSHLDVTFSLPAGKYDTIVQEWDNCGGAEKTPISVRILPGGITVASPKSNSTVTSPVLIKAIETSPTCTNGFSGVLVYSAPGVVAASSFDTSINLSPGKYSLVFQAFDNCNNIFQRTVNITVK
jgi:hypothetical protein